jgi:hypothetical protein
MVEHDWHRRGSNQILDRGGSSQGLSDPQCVGWVERDAMVVLPDHLHAVWTLPEGDADFAARWRLIKSAFSRSLPTGEPISDSRAAQGELGIWQRRYWDRSR